MVYKGHVKNGVVVVDEPVSLPEGAEVEIALTSASGQRIDDENIPTLYEQFKDFIGIVNGLPPDLAQNHDHYIHGCPKR